MKLNSCSKFSVFDFKKKEKNVSNIDMCWEKKTPGTFEETVEKQVEKKKG